MMKKYWYIFCLVVVSMLIMSGCTLNLNAKGNPVIQTSNNQGNPNSQPIHIQVGVYKHYEDGFDLKAELQNATSANGTWTFKQCGKEYVQKDKGISTIASSGYFACEIPAGKENDKSYDNIYVNFSGTVNGQETEVDKIYQLSKEELDKIPLERDNPTNDTPIPDQNQSVNSDHKTYLQKSFALAKQGKVLLSPLAANKNDYESVINKYGEPDKRDNSYPYLEYSKLYLAFGVGKGEVLDDVRSFDPKLHKITRSEVTRILGKPDHIRSLKGQQIYVYDINGHNGHVDGFSDVNGYEFKLIFNLTKKDPTIDHISVFSPWANHDPMAG